MAGSSDNSGGIVNFTINTGGSPIPDYERVLSIYIEQRINRISTARIVLLDGDSSTGTFDASSSNTFVPGSEISIELGYDTSSTLVFKGIITGQNIRIDQDGSKIEVECRDAAVKMIVGRKSLTFSQQKDSDIISSIIGAYPGLTSDVTATTTEWPEQVQYYVTDWDFIMARAETNGMVVNTQNGKVSVFKPDADTTSVLTVGYGDGLYTFNADLNAITQLGSVKASSWDYKNQVVTSVEASSSIAGPGNLSSKTLSAVIGLSDFQLQTVAPLENTDLTSWCNAQLIKSEFSKITGEARILGNSVVCPGKYITLQGLGDRFTGDYLVSGVVHNFSDGNWMTDVSLGLSSMWFTEEPDVMAPSAAGLLPGAQGLFTGTVKKIFDDPDSEYRILVTVPLFDANGAGIWARLSNFYSTSGAGVFFLPEVGDEVILGFLNEDPRSPVILGSLYSSSKIQPFAGLAPNEKNNIKAIVSKSGISIQFDDENKILTVETPAKNTVVISDKDKQISLTDENSNSIVMSSDGITIKSPKNINIQAQQKVTLAGTQGVTVEASAGDVAVTGMNIKETANEQYSAEGSMTAQISSGTQLTMKSAMIMIN